MQSDLYLIGVGCLQNVTQVNHQIFAQIQRLPVSQKLGDRGEEILFNCLVEDPTLKALLSACDAHASQGRTVVVKFAAQYLETTSLQHCVDTCDPDHILTISIKLTAISEIFIEGVKQYEYGVFDNTRRKVANL